MFVELPSAQEVGVEHLQTDDDTVLTDGPHQVLAVGPGVTVVTVQARLGPEGQPTLLT